MAKGPLLIDRTSLARRRARTKAGRGYFLHQEAITDLQDRLQMITKPFTDITIVTGHPAPWAEAFPTAQVVPDDEVLNLLPASNDLVIHAMSLHWANDPLGQMIQCHRALRPDGLFLASLLGGKTLHELRTALAEAETIVRGGVSPRVLPMADIRDLGALLSRAGFNLPVADSHSVHATYPSLNDLMHDLRSMGETNAQSARSRQFTLRHMLQKAEEIYRTRFGLPDGRLPATYEQICVTGWVPDDSHPKPLRPGSAKMRLAEALNVPEVPLKD
ncbi:MAG: methyltransferase domain-containing protein [Paracoccaceae bacterium]